jgi:hypothetical protein
MAVRPSSRAIRGEEAAPSSGSPSVCWEDLLAATTLKQRCRVVRSPDAASRGAGAATRWPFGTRLLRTGVRGVRSRVQRRRIRYTSTYRGLFDTSPNCRGPLLRQITNALTHVSVDLLAKVVALLAIHASTVRANGQAVQDTIGSIRRSLGLVSATRSVCTVRARDTLEPVLERRRPVPRGRSSPTIGAGTDAWERR